MCSVPGTTSRWVFALAFAALFLVGALAAPGMRAQDGAPSCSWTQLAEGKARYDHALVPLPATEQGLLTFGGRAAEGVTETIESDAYVLRLSSGAPGVWSEVPGTGAAPGPRAEHAMILRERPVFGFEAVSFGGVAQAPSADTQGPARSETHALDGLGAWRQIGAQGAPSRYGHATLYWPARDALLSFGGRSGPDPTDVVSDTHRLDLDGESPPWTRLPIAGDGPAARVGHTLVHDELFDRGILFGGTSDGTAGLDDLWALNLGGDIPTWAPLVAAGGAPAARFDHTAAFLPALRWLVVFGGTTDGQDALGDLFVLDLGHEPPSWRTPAVTGPEPGARSGAAAAVARGRFVLYGGVRDGAPLSDAWWLQCDPEQPTGTAPATPEPTTPVPTETLTATTTAEPTTATPEPQTATPTGTTAPPDIPLAGLVYDLVRGRAHAVVGAQVRVPPCHTPHQPFVGISGNDGRYAVTLPGPYFFAGCMVRIEASAAGYAELVLEVPYEDLVAQPERDLALTPLSPTATPTVGPQDVLLHGFVHGAGAGPEAPIAGARVRVPPCDSPHQPFEGLSGPDGAYAVLLPAAYFSPGCTVTIEVSAGNYRTATWDIPWWDLVAVPRRDFGLERAGHTTCYLPLSSRPPR